MIEQRPGITVAELAEAMGLTMTRAWQYVGRLEGGRVRRETSA
jgi:Winged helix-turn-helix DNA-binding